MSINESTVDSDGNTRVKWSYVFRDFGMDHEISRDFKVRCIGQDRYLLSDSASDNWWLVNGVNSLHDVLFDHYEGFRENLYDSMFGARWMRAKVNVYNYAFHIHAHVLSR